MNFTNAFHAVGWGLLCFGLLLAAPLLLALTADEARQVAPFAGSMFLALFCGGLIAIGTRHRSPRTTRRDGILVGLALWFLLPLFGALPLYLGGTGLSFADAWFEALSGLTTTGASIIPNVAELPRSLVFWRGLLQWFGGLMSLIFLIVVFTDFDFLGLAQRPAVIPGSERQDLPERLGRALTECWWLYLSLTAACAVALWLAGMPSFIAVNHAFSIVSSGGFTTAPGDAAYAGNAAIALVMIVFMLLSSIAFALHWAAARGKFSVYRQDPETRYLLAAWLLAFLVFFTSLAGEGMSVDDGLLSAAFNVTSLLSTTGYVLQPGSDGFLWPSLLAIAGIVLVLVGPSSGTAAGGLKLVRLALLFKQSWREVERLSFPHGMVPLRYGRFRIQRSALRSAWAVLVLFLSGFVFLALVLNYLGVVFDDALALSAASIANAGPAIGLMSGHDLGYSELSAAVKAWLMLGMVFGRVEFFAIVIVFHGFFWRR